MSITNVALFIFVFACGVAQAAPFEEMLADSTPRSTSDLPAMELISFSAMVPVVKSAWSGKGVGEILLGSSPDFADGLTSCSEELQNHPMFMKRHSMDVAFLLEKSRGRVVIGRSPASTLRTANPASASDLMHECVSNALSGIEWPRGERADIHRLVVKYELERGATYREVFRRHAKCSSRESFDLKVFGFSLPESMEVSSEADLNEQALPADPFFKAADVQGTKYFTRNLFSVGQQMGGYAPPQRDPQSEHGVTITAIVRTRCEAGDSGSSRTRYWDVLRIPPSYVDDPAILEEEFAVLKREEIRQRDQLSSIMDWTTRGTWKGNLVSIVEVIQPFPSTKLIRIARFRNQVLYDVLIGEVTGKDVEFGLPAKATFRRSFFPAGNQKCTSHHLPIEWKAFSGRLGRYIRDPISSGGTSLERTKNGRLVEVSKGGYSGSGVGGDGFTLLGQFTCLDESGGIAARGRYDEGRPEGQWVYTDPQGQTQSRTFRDGKDIEASVIGLLLNGVESPPATMVQLGVQGALSQFGVFIMLEWTMVQSGTNKYRKETSEYERQFCAGPWQTIGRGIGPTERAKRMQEICGYSWFYEGYWLDSSIGAGAFHIDKNYCAQRVARLCKP